ncbi:MAG TPA: Tad domain-containing protein [Candidatus Baltobacteraceae bacterium]|nr:Tad domain-containing protein [Candidatus Baltobacteraceae bacterium]
MSRLESQRGQTLPFWVIGVLVVLSMMFFLANYANAVAWQVRAQNAADGAASAVLSVQANVYNEYSTVLYATAVDEYRIRALNQAILNTIYGFGCTSCDSDYISLTNEYNNAVYSYTQDIHLLDQANNMTQAGQSTDQAKALSLIQSSNWCSNSSDYSCSFGFKVLDASSSTGSTGNGNNNGYIVGGDNQTDLIACKNVSYFGAGLLGLGSTATYQVLGRAAAAVIPASSESFSPAAINPQTGQQYQPTETQWAVDAPSQPALQVNFSGLTVNLNWYEAGTIRPYITTVGTPTCK